MILKFLQLFALLTLLGSIQSRLSLISTAYVKNGVYKFTAKIGEYKDGTEFMPDHKWWCELRGKGEYYTLEINHAWLEKEPIKLWVE